MMLRIFSCAYFAITYPHEGNIFSDLLPITLVGF